MDGSAVDLLPDRMHKNIPIIYMSSISGIETSGASARMIGDSANIPSFSELSSVQTGGRKTKGSKTKGRKTMGRKTKARKSMWYSGGKHKKSHKSRSRRRR